MNNRIIDKIANYADIDTRRALGVYGRLPKSTFNPRPIHHVSWRYWPDTGVAIYFSAKPNRDYEFEVHTHLNYDADSDTWNYVPGARVTSVRANRLRSRFTFSEFFPAWSADINRFSFATNPEFIDQEP